VVIDVTLVLEARLCEWVEGYMGVELPIDYVEGLFLKDSISDSCLEQAFADGLW
jgi:hypothetical protein